MREDFSLFFFGKLSKHKTVRQPVRHSCSPDLEHELPLARHVQHQPLGAPEASAERLHRGLVVHAVPVLRHVGVDVHGLDRPRGLAADGDVERRRAGENPLVKD